MKTAVVVSCYQGDVELVKRHLPYWQHHGFPVYLFSPCDSTVILPGVICRSFGRAAYIGDTSLQRHLRYLREMLKLDYDYFLMTDPDAFCLSPELPARLFDEDCVWTNEVIEPRPHESPYPKIAMQPPFFMRRTHIQKLLDVAHKVVAHPITPYIDWFQLALVREAKLFHRPFTDLEHPSTAEPFGSSDSWEQLEYRIRNMGTLFMHPIKERWQLDLCLNAYNDAQTTYDT